MSTPKLWVWVGSSDDTLDVMRYVTATEQDIIGQTCVRDRIRELEAEIERLRKESAEAFAAYIQQHEGMVESPVRMDGVEGTGLQSAFVALGNFRDALEAVREGAGR